MTIPWRATNWIGALAALLILPAGGVFSNAAESAELPVPAKEATQPARQMHKTCVGMDGTPFRWDSANAPFASNCHMEEDKPAAPSEQKPGAK